MQYLRSSGNRSARLQTAGAAQMRYEIIRWKDGVERLCETAFFDSLGAFLYTDFFRGLNQIICPGNVRTATGGFYSPPESIPAIAIAR